jgi:hypothetical protein
LRAPFPGGFITVKSVTVDGQDFTKRPIDAGNGRNVGNVVITFSGKVPSLVGRATDADGGGATRSAIIAFTTDRSVWPDLGLQPVFAKTAPIATDGTFTLVGPPAGEYFVAAFDLSHFADRFDPAFLEQLAPLATRVSLDWGVQKSVDLKAVTIR